jgi:hypothetical protein
LPGASKRIELAAALPAFNFTNFQFGHLVSFGVAALEIGDGTIPRVAAVDRLRRVAGDNADDDRSVLLDAGNSETGLPGSLQRPSDITQLERLFTVHKKTKCRTRPTESNALESIKVFRPPYSMYK